MGKLDRYKIDLKGMKNDTEEYAYTLDDEFFQTIDAPVMQKGKVQVDLTVKRIGETYELTFQIVGTIQVPCDRCLDDMDLKVSTTDKLRVMMGVDYAEEDEVVTIPKEDGFINVAWLIYEFIALSIPMKHVHVPGQCNKAMEGKLNEHLRVDTEDESLEADSQEIDPRWNDLKKILDNN